MWVAFEEAFGETQLLFNTNSHGIGDNVAIELELLPHGGLERGGDLLRIYCGGCAACAVVVAVAGHGCDGLERLGEGRVSGCCGGLFDSLSINEK